MRAMKEYERIIMNDSERSEQSKLIYTKIKMLATVRANIQIQKYTAHTLIHISISKLAVTMMTATLTAASAPSSSIHADNRRSYENITKSVYKSNK